MSPEPEYVFKKGEGWVLTTNTVEILGQDDFFYVVDLADVPQGVKRSYAPWHPDHKVYGNNGGGIREALDAARDARWFPYGAPVRRGQLVCAIHKDVYEELERDVNSWQETP